MAKTSPIIYDQFNKPARQAGGLYFNPYSYGNIGKFRPRNYYNVLQDTDKAVNATDRTSIVSLSRLLFSQMGELNAASKQKANWTVGSGFDPVYSGKNQEWANEVAQWLKNDWYNNCSVKGFAYDFKTILKLISRSLDKDGDILLVYTSNRAGLPLLQFVHTHRIASRNASDTTMKGGRYDGYPIVKGVIYNNSGTPIAYNILGDSKEEDYQVSTANAQLIFDPEVFDDGRGLPVLASALSDGLHLQDISDYLIQAIKIESSIQLIETNELGEADEEFTGPNFVGAGGTSPLQGPTIQNAQPVVEFMEGGNRYLKAGSGKLDSFATNRPAQSTQDFIQRIEKRLLASMEWPHQVLLSPESVGGAAARGVGELVRRSVAERQKLIKRYAKTALVYAIGRAMQSGIIPANYKEDWTNWSFTDSPQFVLDAGYERAADLSDLQRGVKTLDDITTKYGKRAVDVRAQRETETLDLLSRIKAIQTAHPEFSIEFIANYMQQPGVNGLPMTPTQPEPSNQQV